MPPSPPLLLASTSPYRSRLLERLGLSFERCDPDVNEAAEPARDPATRARRLALAKARAGATRHSGHWTIGSDQVAECEGDILHKPGSRAAQIAQLQRMSGREAHFHTAVALVVPPLRPGARARARHATVLTRVRFRTLDDDTIARYADAEPAVDCCGGFRCEGLGIALFDAVRGSDPTALEGLPLMATARLLRAAGLAVP